MTPEKSKALCDKHVKLFPRKNADDDFYFECDDGWFDLLDVLCSRIQPQVDRELDEFTPEEAEIHQPVVLQVKEKFGGLRFYVGSCSEVVRGMISLAESMSFRICEACGDKGSPHRSARGWIQTLCESCRDLPKVSP